MCPLTPEDNANIKNILTLGPEARLRSTGASVAFHEKLAVLTAGSVALVVSGAGLLHQRPLPTTFSTRWLVSCLAVSAVLLWLSLVSSILHNLLESCALHFSAEAASNQAVREFADFAEQRGDEFEYDEIKGADEVRKKIARRELREHSRANQLRKYEMPLSVASVVLFTTGYLTVIVYVLILAFH